MRSLWKLLCTLSTAALLISGCGGVVQTYEGSRRDAQEVAILKTNVGALSFDTVWVDVVDGKNLVRAYSELQLSPGRHGLRVQLSSGILRTTRLITFDAEAGRIYRVQGVMARSGTYAWIEDDMSKEFVAGEKP